MSLNVFNDIRKMFTRVDAGRIRQDALRDLSVGLMASSQDSESRMESFLAPPDLVAGQRDRALRSVRAVDDSPRSHDIVLCDPGVTLPPNGFLFEAGNPESLVDLVLHENESLELALACTFSAFRTAVTGRLIQRVARENALFSIVTALPNVIPSVIELPWVAGEFASDTVFLTMNQIRLALMLSAANGQPASYSDLKLEIGAIVAGAFGWRAIARELVGKIPLGGGLIPKAAISFGATWVVGLGVDKALRTGRPLTRAEREAAYEFGLANGRDVALELAERPRRNEQGERRNGE